MTEIEQLIEQAEKTLANLPMPEPVIWLYIGGHIEGLYIIGLLSGGLLGGWSGGSLAYMASSYGVNYGNQN